MKIGNVLDLSIAVLFVQLVSLCGCGLSNPGVVPTPALFQDVPPEAHFLLSLRNIPALGELSVILVSQGGDEVERSVSAILLSPFGTRLSQITTTTAGVTVSGERILSTPERFLTALAELLASRRERLEDDEFTLTRVADPT